MAILNPIDLEKRLNDVLITNGPADLPINYRLGTFTPNLPRADVIHNTPALADVGVKGRKQRGRGSISIQLCVAGKSEVEGNGPMAVLLASLFPHGMQLELGEWLVTIDQTPQVGMPYEHDGKYKFPITVRYTVGN